MTMLLDPARRAALVADLMAALRSATTGGRVALRGSLAEGRADEYSDIDLWWAIPDALFAACLERLPAILAGARPVESLRFDPDLQRSDRRRLAFVRFAGLPLFWRVDLDIVARSAADDPRYDLDNPAARGDDWSRAESALANAVAAVKARRRGHDGEAWALLRRACARLGLPSPAGSLTEAIARLTVAAAEQEPATAALAERVRRLAADLVIQ